MRSGGGKSKGNSFERSCCKQLSLWLTDGERDDLLWRTAMSGGRATIGMRQGKVRKAQAGDIGAIDSLAEALLDIAVIECKFYSNLNIDKGLLGGEGYLKKFWFTNKKLARSVNKYSILIGKQNAMPPFIMLEDGCVSLFELQTISPAFIVPYWGCYVYSFDVFLKFARVPQKVDEFKPKRNRL